jgi:hypothetical protein
LTAALHLLQPLARLRGRVRFGLTPWRRRGWQHLAFPRRRTTTCWSERWHAPEDRLRAIEGRLRDAGAAVRRGGDFDRWDLDVRGGLFGSGRLLMAIEEHGGGKQLIRCGAWPRWSGGAIVLMTLLATLAVTAIADGAPVAGLVLGVTAVALGLRALLECAAATGALARALAHGAPESDR